MPELPEVETIKNQLLAKVRDKNITDVKIIDYVKNVKGDSKKLLAKITGIKRRAKLLIFTLSNGHSFIIHLKLTGQLIYYSQVPEKIEKKTHVIFYFKGGSALLFNDFRKFGFVKIMETNEVEDYFKKQKFGPEPLKISYQQFRGLLQKKGRSRIKPVLLDQKFIAGIGNIYAQEACFRAGIMPDRIISTLTENEVKRLYLAIQKILKSAVEHKGTSFDTTYVTATGQPGKFDQYLKVYHQKECSKCKSKLKIVKLGGRSTYYCEKCQI